MRWVSRLIAVAIRVALVLKARKARNPMGRVVHVLLLGHSWEQDEQVSYASLSKASADYKAGMSLVSGSMSRKDSVMASTPAHMC